MRATSSVGVVLVVLLLAGLLSACGDEHGSAGGAATGTTTAAATPAPRPPESARTIARAALVSLDDFPVGWGRADVPVPDVRCGDLNPYAGARAISGSQRILLDQTGVQETVAVFASDGASRRGFARINAPGAMRCLRQDVRREMSTEAGGQASPLQIARVERLGRWGRATRLSATAPSSIGQVTGSIDAVHMRVGRGLGALVIVSGLGPVDDALYARVLKLFSRRLHAALG